jgi:dUTP pyrophosphatase
MKVRISKTRPDAVIPAYQTPGACCFDVACIEDATLAPGEIVDLPTGLIFAVPGGYMLMVAPRSSTPKKGVHMPHGIGIIDQDYCGPEDELKIRVRNFTGTTVFLRKGDRVCQAGFVRVDRAELEEGPVMAVATRGGFGSTG